MKERKRILLKAEAPKIIKEKVLGFLEERGFKTETEYLLHLVRTDLQEYEAKKEKAA